MITVYTQPGCRPCKRVLDKLADARIVHRVVDVTKDAAGLEYIKSWGATSVPVIQVDGSRPIIGYEPGLLKELIAGQQLDIKPKVEDNDV